MFFLIQNQFTQPKRATNIHKKNEKKNTATRNSTTRTVTLHRSPHLQHPPLQHERPRTPSPPQNARAGLCIDERETHRLAIPMINVLIIMPGLAQALVLWFLMSVWLVRHDWDRGTCHISWYIKTVGENGWLGLASVWSH